MFLEIGIEPQYFSVVFEPRGLNTWDVIVLWCLPWFLEGKVAERLSHLIDQVLIDFLIEELTLLLLGTINEIELLGLVIVLLIGIVEDVTGEEWNLFRNVELHILT
jgi:hypothetical protein